MAKSKVFSAIIHQTSKTLRGYVRTTSRAKAAAIFGLSAYQAQDRLSQLSDDEAAKYDHLQDGEPEYIDANKMPLPQRHSLRERDLFQIGDVSVIQAAERMLQTCDISDPALSARLRQIRDDLDELKIDLKEAVTSKYKAYAKPN